MSSSFLVVVDDEMQVIKINRVFIVSYYRNERFSTTWEFFKNEKNVQPKVVPNNQYFSPFQLIKS